MGQNLRRIESTVAGHVSVLKTEAYVNGHCVEQPVSYHSDHLLKETKYDLNKSEKNSFCLILNQFI